MPAPVGVLFLQVARRPFVFCFPLMGDPRPLFFPFCWLAKKVILKRKTAETKYF